MRNRKRQTELEEKGFIEVPAEIGWKLFELDDNKARKKRWTTPSS